MLTITKFLNINDDYGFITRLEFLPKTMLKLRCFCNIMKQAMVIRVLGEMWRDEKPGVQIGYIVIVGHFFFLNPIVKVLHVHHLMNLWHWMHIFIGINSPSLGFHMERFCIVDNTFICYLSVWCVWPMKLVASNDEAFGNCTES